MITEAVTDAERRQVQDLFAARFSGIPGTAVPATGVDDMYAPIVARYVDPDSGQLVGAALTCRCEAATVGIAQARTGRSNPFASVLDRHSELDLLAVAPQYRGRGIGARLVGYLQERLAERGVRVWFGTVTGDLDVAALRAFYVRLGFTVGEPGAQLPPLLGKDWAMPGRERPAFTFYKTLARVR